MPEHSTTPKAKAPLLDSKPRGANRSTKVAGKLKVLPEQPENLPILGAKTPTTKPTKDYESVGTTGDSEDGDIEESEGDVEVCRYIFLHITPFNLLLQVYNQISLIPEGAARRDALRLTKKKAKSLPRVTAYATAR
jgi:hypothetical protein